MAREKNKNGKDQHVHHFYVHQGIQIKKIECHKKQDNHPSTNYSVFQRHCHQLVFQSEKTHEKVLKNDLPLFTTPIIPPFNFCPNNGELEDFE